MSLPLPGPSEAAAAAGAGDRLPTPVRIVIALLVVASLVELYRAALAFVRAGVGVVVKDPSLSAAANLADALLTLTLALIALGLARALAHRSRGARGAVVVLLGLRIGVSAFAIAGGGWPLSAFVTIALSAALIALLVRGPARAWFTEAGR